MTRSLPPGLYEALITESLAKVLADLKSEHYVAEEVELDTADSHIALTRHLAIALARALESLPEENRLERQIELVNEILAVLSHRATQGRTRTN